MAIGPREVMRSEVEGGLSGPANPIPNESLDCGCGQFPCPRLAKFATRRLFVGLLCWIGTVQAAAHAYLYMTSPTIARRFQIDPIFMEWILVVAELTPFALGFLVAYWGDRIHRAAWTGALVLLQGGSFVLLIIPQFIHTARTIEEPENVTHMSVYAESGLAKLVLEEDRSCYTTLALLVGVQLLTGMANVAYYALGFSYLDDNTKKIHVAALVGAAVAVKILGLSLGYILAWGCLKLDAENLQVIVAYREQVGAWWLGWPVLAAFLAIPGTLVSWLPRRLPSEVVEQAAASILDLAGRASPPIRQETEAPKVGGTGYFASLLRLCANKFIVCNVLVGIFCFTALVNFVARENVFLESRYHVPRPTGMLLSFGDPLWSRIIANMLKPIVIGMVIIISGMVIVRVKPRAPSLTIYNVVVYVMAATIIFCLVYANCEKRGGSTSFLKYCNNNCRCSKDAASRPICNGESTLIFCNPCRAGCDGIDVVNNVRIYDHCSCMGEATGFDSGREGPCGASTCQVFLFEVMTLLVYCLAASSIVGSLLITLRSVYVQDKALAIAFWMAFVSLFAYVPGKIAYDKIADATCKDWGGDAGAAICHLHDGEKLGDYLCYLTAFLLILAAGFEMVLWYFCRQLRLYNNPTAEMPRDTELREVERHQAVPLLDGNSAAAPANEAQNNEASQVEQVVVIESSDLDLRERTIDEDSHQRSEPLKYGPLGPGDRRTTSRDTGVTERKIRRADTDDELDTSSDEEGANDAENKKKNGNSSPQVAYRPLELDSDVESDLSSIGPRSRRRVPSSIFDEFSKDDQPQTNPSTNKRPFPNPDDYETSSRTSTLTATRDPRNGKSLDNLDATNAQGGFSRTNSFEFAKKKGSNDDSLRSREGDFNEVGIPVMTPLVAASIMTTFGHSRPEVHHQEVQVLLPRHQKQASQERLDTIRSLLESVDETRRHRLENDTLHEVENENYADLPPPIIGKLPSRGRASSSFASSPDVGEKKSVSAVASPATSRTNSPKDGSTKGGPLSTAL